MTWLEAIILGIVEGLTEYLPVSSTGHLILAQRAMGLEGDAANAYAICIQAGAILAVLSLYWKRTWQAIRGWAGKIGIGPGDPAGFRLGLNIVVAFMPAAVIGLLFDDAIEAYLFGLWPIVFAWFVGGVAILVVARMRKATRTGKDNALAEGERERSGGLDLDAMTWRMALIIGLIQCLAMWPGTSRSLVTIVGGVLVGLSLASAVEFSFLLGVVTLVAATLYKALLDSVVVDGQDMMMVLWMAREYGWTSMIIGSVAAWASAVLAVKWMVAYLKRRGLSIFGYYRVGIAVVVAALILTNVLTPQ
jgi:undecaprenyl-diphosphatase